MRGRGQRTSPQKREADNNSVKLDERDIMMKEEMRRESAARRNASSNSPVYVGLVVELRDNFGFVQAICCAGMPSGNASLNKMAEQLYFQDREGYSGMEIGNEVFFQVRDAARGPQAVSLRRINADQKMLHNQSIMGTVVKEADLSSRSPRPMVVQLSTPLKCTLSADVHIVSCLLTRSGASFVHKASASSSNNPRRGDDVEVLLTIIPQTSYCVASALQIVKTKAEKQIAEMVLSLEKSGIAREQGTIESVRSSEQYGFIAGADRNGQLFFRFEDVAANTSSADLTPSTEIEFYVIQENVKGRLSDRAIQLRVLPKGTVKTEYLLAKQVLGTVIVEPQTHPREEPGMLHLDTPITLPDALPLPKVAAGMPAPSRVLTQIELWPRCAPSCLVFRQGDKLRLDVHYYRPEKLNFARDVHVQSYRLLGRESGRVHSLKPGGYGFISLGASNNPVTNTSAAATGEKFVYFRSTDVVGVSGDVMAESAVTVGMPLAYDVSYEKTKSGEVRLSATRVAQMPDTGDKSSSSSSSSISTSNDGAMVLLRKGCKGVVVRKHGERLEHTGSVLITALGAAPASPTTKNNRKKKGGDDKQPQQPSQPPMSVADIVTKGMVDALTQFKKHAAVSKVTEGVIEHIYLHSAIRYFSVLAGYKSTVSPADLKALAGIACEYANAPVPGAKSLRLYLLPGYESGTNDEDSDVLRAWRQRTCTMLEESEKMGYGGAASANKDAASAASSSRPLDPKEVKAESLLQEFSYSKNDAVEGALGPLIKDATVECNLYLDRASNKPVARAVRLTDEVVPLVYTATRYTTTTFQSTSSSEQEDDVALFKAPKIAAGTSSLCKENTSATTTNNNNTQLGVLETVFSRAGARYGHLRAIPSDEKLFWHSSSLHPDAQQAGMSAKDLLEGRAVYFECRRRGGARVAVSLRPVESAVSIETSLLGLAGQIPMEEVRECMVPRNGIKDGADSEDVAVAVVVGDGTTAVPIYVPAWAKVAEALPPGVHNQVKLWKFDEARKLLQQQNKLNPRTKKPVKSDGQWTKESIAVPAASTDVAADALSLEPLDAALPPVAPSSSDVKEKEEVSSAPASDTNTEEEDDMRFYAPVARLPVPIADAGLHTYPIEGEAARPGYLPGSLIYCQLKYSPLSRQVLSLHYTAPVDTTTSSSYKQKKMGVVSRMAIRLRNPSNNSSTAAARAGGAVSGVSTGDNNSTGGPAESMLELTELKNKENPEDVAYCLWPSELGAPAGSVNTNISSSLSLGDEVEYWASGGSSSSGKFVVAFGVTVIRRNGGGAAGAGGGGVANTSGIVFTRPGSLNKGLQSTITKQAASKISGQKGVVMAKGPAEDGSIGFVPGWRSKERVLGWKEQPWAHLLPWQDLLKGD